MPKTLRRELSPPQQRHLQRRIEDEQELKRVADALKKHFLKQDLALRRWAKPAP
jgi:hypothetical protein